MSYFKTLAAGTLLAGATIFGSCTNNKPQTSFSCEMCLKGDTVLKDTVELGELKKDTIELLKKDTIIPNFPKFPAEICDSMNRILDGVAPNGDKVSKTIKISKKDLLKLIKK